jgi:SNF2 family DNA or RNA helicase
MGSRCFPGRLAEAQAGSDRFPRPSTLRKVDGAFLPLRPRSSVRLTDFKFVSTQILCDLLDLWSRQGDKVLIFSMSLKVLDLLKDLMETTRYTYVELDGSTPQEERALSSPFFPLSLRRTDLSPLIPLLPQA